MSDRAVRCCVKCRDDLRGGLNQFDQHAFAGNRKGIVCLGMQKGDVETGGTLADAARCKTHPL